MEYRNIPACFILFICSTCAYANSDTLIASVYHDDNISVAAGVVEMENRIIQFGDVLPLVIEFSYDPGSVRLPDIGPEFFTQGWPEEMGAYLLDVSNAPVSPSSSGPEITDTFTFRFQILACPEAKVLCKGSRFFELPEFTLEFSLIDSTGNEISMETVQFQPWPENLMIASAIPLGAEGELNSFATYFPTGAYPNPLTGRDLRKSFSGLIAGGLFFLLGGILMSPFSFFKQKAFAQKSKKRWEEVLETLKSGELQDEKQFLDSLRKCLVWYCVDELKVDPFYWLKHEEEVMSDDHKGVGNLAGYRDLFIDVLHSPSGQNDALFERFNNLITIAS